MIVRMLLVCLPKEILSINRDLTENNTRRSLDVIKAVIFAFPTTAILTIIQINSDDVELFYHCYKLNFADKILV